MGGGSGGHVTPAVAVVREIFGLKPRSQIEFWTDFKYYKNVAKLITEMGLLWGDDRNKVSQYIRVRRIMAGKFHRYSSWTFMTYIKRFDLTIKDLFIGNILGFFGFIGGIIISFVRLFKKYTRPDVVFLKGGFVCLPVGLVAHFFKIPYVVHESDVTPGLANKILIKHAKKVLFGTPLAPEVLDAHPNYEWVGIPIGPEFHEITEARQKSLKKAFSFNPEKPLVVITGGSQGASSLNEATRVILPELLKFTSVGLVAGHKHYEEIVSLKKYENWEKTSLESNFRLWEFNTTMDELMGAADVVVSRAGATTIAELAALQKAVILVPYEILTGNHQIKNAERLEKLGAVSVIRNEESSKNPELLLDEIKRLVRSPRQRESMAKKLHDESKSDAARQIAEIVIAEGTAR